MAYERLEYGVSTRGVAITPSDSTNLSEPVRALYVGTGGDVVVCPQGQDNTLTLKNVIPGAFLPIAIKRIDSTNTTGSDFVGFI